MIPLTTSDSYWAFGYGYGWSGGAANGERDLHVCWAFSYLSQAKPNVSLLMMWIGGVLLVLLLSTYAVGESFIDPVMVACTFLLLF